MRTKSLYPRNGLWFCSIYLAVVWLLVVGVYNIISLDQCSQVTVARRPQRLSLVPVYNSRDISEVYGPLLPDEHHIISGSCYNTIGIWENMGYRELGSISTVNCSSLPPYLMTEPLESGIDTETDAAASKPPREHKI